MWEPLVGPTSHARTYSPGGRSCARVEDVWGKDLVCANALLRQFHVFSKQVQLGSGETTWTRHLPREVKKRMDFHIPLAQGLERETSGVITTTLSLSLQEKPT